MCGKTWETKQHHKYYFFVFFCVSNKGSLSRNLKLKCQRPFSEKKLLLVKTRKELKHQMSSCGSVTVSDTDVVHTWAQLSHWCHCGSQSWWSHVGMHPPGVLCREVQWLLWPWPLVLLVSSVFFIFPLSLEEVSSEVLRHLQRNQPMSPWSPGDRQSLL